MLNLIQRNELEIKESYTDSEYQSTTYYTPDKKGVIEYIIDDTPGMGDISTYLHYPYEEDNPYLIYSAHSFDWSLIDKRQQ